MDPPTASPCPKTPPQVHRPLRYCLLHTQIPMLTVDAKVTQRWRYAFEVEKNWTRKDWKITKVSVDNTSCVWRCHSLSEFQNSTIYQQRWSSFHLCKVAVNEYPLAKRHATSNKLQVRNPSHMVRNSFLRGPKISFQLVSMKSSNPPPAKLARIQPPKTTSPQVTTRPSARSAPKARCEASNWRTWRCWVIPHHLAGSWNLEHQDYPCGNPNRNRPSYDLRYDTLNTFSKNHLYIIQ